MLLFVCKFGVYPVEALCPSQWKEEQKSEVLFASLGGQHAENTHQTGTYVFLKVEGAHIPYIVRETCLCIPCWVGTKPS